MKVKWEYEKLRVEYQAKPSIYTPDFQLANGVIIEVKGRFLPPDRTKHVRIKEQHPELDIRFVFQYNDWLTKTKTNRYGDWCDKHGFLWAVMEVPKCWTT